MKNYTYIFRNYSSILKYKILELQNLIPMQVEFRPVNLFTQKSSYVFNPIQDGSFRGCSGMAGGRGAAKSPPC